MVSASRFGIYHFWYVDTDRGTNIKVKCTLVQALRLCTGRTAHRGSRGIALLFLDHDTRRGWGVSVTSRPLFPPGKTWYPLYTRLGGPQGRSGQVRIISPPPGFDPRTVQPVASRYTDYATRRGTNICSVNFHGVTSKNTVSTNIFTIIFYECISFLLHTTSLIPSITVFMNYTLVSFDVLLTVHFSIYILVINQLDAQNFVLQ